jgi:hypothetical protein
MLITLFNQLIIRGLKEFSDRVIDKMKKNSKRLPT